MNTIDFRTFNRSYLMPHAVENNHSSALSFHRRNLDMLDEARMAWESIADFRAQRARSRNYTFGKQWSDPIILPDGRTITEEQYLREQGKVPLKNNMIRQLVKSVLGQFRAAQTEPVCVARDRNEQALSELMTTVMQYVYQLNRIYELDSRTLEEFLISGSCFHKIGYGSRHGKSDVWVDAIPPSRIFFNNMQDARLWDCSLIGELHDMTLNDIIARFARGDKGRAHQLHEIYGNVSQEHIYHAFENLSSQPLDSLDFFVPSSPDSCRVIEVWKLTHCERLRCHDTLSGEYYKVDASMIADIDNTNKIRIEQAALQGIEKLEVPLIETEWFVDTVWYYWFLSPLGDVLDHGETPYWHGEHPYSLRLYPLFDGEIHSFVEDVIDQQRYINRLITMVDFIMGSSAKGVLIFPEDQIPDGMTIDDIATEWTRYNGVILFRPKPGSPMPQQISVNATNVGAYELLSLQMRLLEDISGVHSAIQGKNVSGGTASSLYAQQVQYSATNLLDIFESFKTFREERDNKILKTLQQFYNDARYETITGDAMQHITTPEMVRNAEFDISITESAAAPAFRQSSNDFLLALFRSGHISLSTLLQTGAFPFADKLMQHINIEQQQQLEQMASILQQPTDTPLSQQQSPQQPPSQQPPVQRQPSQPPQSATHP
ncbi:MAG: hypothetical protein IKJ79_06030 [Bacteroidaceae bacterium]|nr:hypothetical protein [Bacteroidaceae bacterium]